MSRKTSLKRFQTKNTVCVPFLGCAIVYKLNDREVVLPYLKSCVQQFDVNILQEYFEDGVDQKFSPICSLQQRYSVAFCNYRRMFYWK